MRCLLLMFVAFCYAKALKPVLVDPPIRACTLIGCVPPPPGCKQIGTAFPNGRHCPGCKVCLDKPQVCTRRACPPPPTLRCRRPGHTYPNGRNCPSCPVCLDNPRPCTKIGCPPKPGPFCSRIGTTYPNGGHCPGCRVCLDKPRACTKIGCPSPPKTPCANPITTYPNGRHCPPCKVCASRCPAYPCALPPFTCKRRFTPKDKNGCPLCPRCLDPQILPVSRAH